MYGNSNKAKNSTTILRLLMRLKRSCSASSKFIYCFDRSSNDIHSDKLFQTQSNTLDSIISDHPYYSIIVRGELNQTTKTGLITLPIQAPRNQQLKPPPYVEICCCFSISQLTFKITAYTFEPFPIILFVQILQLAALYTF